MNWILSFDFILPIEKLKVWNMTFFCDQRDLRPHDWIMGEPLFHNFLIQTNIFSSSSVRNYLVRAGCKKIEHLRDENGWRMAIQMLIQFSKR